MAGQFVLLGLIVLFGVLSLGDGLPTTIVDWGVAAAGVLEIAIGGRWLVRGFRELGPNLTPVPRPLAEGTLVRSGIYAEVRHPIYAGLILASVGWASLTGSLPAAGLALLLGLYLDAKSRREEAWLSDRYADYEAYRLVSHRFLRGVY